MAEKYQDVRFVVYCNGQAMDALAGHPRVEKKYLRDLDDQFRKAFWLEFQSAPVIEWFIWRIDYYRR